MVLGELHASGMTDIAEGMRTAPWLARETMMPGGVARSKVKVATALRERFAVLQAALVAGRVRFEHVRLIVDKANPRIIDLVEGAQDQLVEMAQGAIFERWRAEVVSLFELFDQDGPHDPNADVPRSKMTMSPTTGETVLRGSLTGDDQMRFCDPVIAHAQVIRRRILEDNKISGETAVPSQAELQAMAVVELVARGAGIDLHATRKAPGPATMFVVNAGEPDKVHDRNGVRLADGSVRSLFCACESTQAIVVDSLGVPLDMGRKVRLATAAQRAALEMQFGGCTAAGCPAPFSWTEMHHLEQWHLGGKTDLGSLLPGCSYHHTVWHRPGWRAWLEDGWPAFQAPNGRTHWGQRHGKQRTGPPPEPPPLE